MENIKEVAKQFFAALDPRGRDFVCEDQHRRNLGAASFVADVEDRKMAHADVKCFQNMRGVDCFHLYPVRPDAESRIISSGVFRFGNGTWTL